MASGTAVAGRPDRWQRQNFGLRELHHGVAAHGVDVATNGGRANHILSQWRAAFYSLYTQAEILGERIVIKQMEKLKERLDDNVKCNAQIGNKDEVLSWASPIFSATKPMSSNIRPSSPKCGTSPAWVMWPAPTRLSIFTSRPDTFKNKMTGKAFFSPPALRYPTAWPSCTPCSATFNTVCSRKRACLLRRLGFDL